MDFLVYHERQRVRFEVYDADVCSADDFLGCFEATVANLLSIQKAQGDRLAVKLPLDTTAADADSREKEDRQSELTVSMRYDTLQPIPCNLAWENEKSSSSKLVVL